MIKLKKIIDYGGSLLRSKLKSITGSILCSEDVKNYISSYVEYPDSLQQIVGRNIKLSLENSEAKLNQLKNNYIIAPGHKNFLVNDVANIYYNPFVGK